MAIRGTTGRRVPRAPESFQILPSDTITKRCFAIILSILFLSPLLAGCAATPASQDADGEAEDAAEPAAFRLADADRDGVVSATEWERRIDALFGLLDEDGSRFIELDELRGQFSQLDQDGDGLVEIEDIGVLAATADQDGDGGLSEDEFADVDWQATGIDANLDGRIGPSEFRKPQRHTFDSFDRNGDDRLEAGEVDDLDRFAVVSF